LLSTEAVGSGLDSIRRFASAIFPLIAPKLIVRLPTEIVPLGVTTLAGELAFGPDGVDSGWLATTIGVDAGVGTGVAAGLIGGIESVTTTRPRVLETFGSETFATAIGGVTRALSVTTTRPRVFVEASAGNWAFTAALVNDKTTRTT
jgi:hypothetical protein